MFRPKTTVVCTLLLTVMTSLILGGTGSLLDRCVLRSDQALICRLPQTDTSYKVINHFKILLSLPASFKVVF